MSKTRLPIEVVGNSIEDASAGLEESKSWLVRARRAVIVAALSELYLVTARRSEDGDNRKAMLNVMEERLTELPEDLVLAQIKRYRGIYFPALDEIRLPVEQSDRYRRRVFVAAAFHEAKQRIGADPVTPRKRITPEEFNAIRRRIDAEYAAAADVSCETIGEKNV